MKRCKTHCMFAYWHNQFGDLTGNNEATIKLNKEKEKLEVILFCSRVRKCWRYRLIDGQRKRETDRQMSRKTDRQIDRKSDKLGLVEASIRSDEGRNALNVRFRISLRWPIHIINPIDKAKLFYNTPHRRSTAVFFFFLKVSLFIQTDWLINT